MLGNKSWNEWIAEYSLSHQNPINRICHTIGIPMIVLSLLMLVAALFVSGLWFWALALFVSGWIFQFVGHAVEGKKPEFFKDWRFLLVGLRWWIAKITGQANSK
ncbi:MAG: Mpo1-like protein [Flavobacteriales bacterium]